MKKHHLHVYVAQQEGKPIPSSPAIKSATSQPMSPLGRVRDTISTDSLSSEKVPSLKLNEQDFTPADSGITSITPPLISKKPARAIPASVSNQNLAPSLPVSGKSLEAISQNSGKLRALYDFEAANELEVSVKVGDVLFLVMERDDGWTQCQTENGTEGLVPSAYVGKE
jgi:hypothetical protein